MSHHKITMFAVAIGLSAASTAAFASEKAIKRADVPQPVLAAVTAKYPNAKLTHFAVEVEGGETLYEVVLDAGPTHSEVSVSAAGKIMSEETTMSATDLPAAVQKSLAESKYAKAKVLRVERVVDAKAPRAATFELMVEQSGKRHELAFDEAGKLARVE